MRVSPLEVDPRPVRLHDIERMAADHGVELADALLIALNLWGLSTHREQGRARLEVDLAPAVSDGPEWHVIVPTGRNSPFSIRGDDLLLGSDRVSHARAIEHDDAQLGYVRGHGRGLTLNTNRRSTCTGCVFCPNTLADAADPRATLDGEELSAFLDFLCLREGWKDLRDVEQVNLSTGCFGTPRRATEHLARVRAVLDRFAFSGRLGILSSVIRTPDDFARMRAAAGECALFLTLECIGRRDLILKDTKADLTPERAVGLLEDARAADVDTGVTLIVGLDDPEVVVDWLHRAAPSLTDFPNLQVYQSHGPLMDVFRHPGADRLGFMLGARRSFEAIPFASKPVWWQNFRPLWYRQFSGERLR